MVFNDNQKRWVLTLLFFSLAIVAFYMIKPYIGALFVGGLLTYFLYPYYIKLVSRTKNKKIALMIISLGSAIVLFILGVIIIIPLMQQTEDLVSQSDDYFNLFIDVTGCSDDSFSCSAMQSLREYAAAHDFAYKSSDFLKATFSFLFSSISSVISGFISLLLFVVILIFSIFYFLDHGSDIKEMILEVIPMQKSHKKKIFSRLKETVDAVIKGSIATALLEGIIGGIIFWALGIPLPFFWGLLIAVFAFIPMIGPAVIWVPSVIFLLIQKNYTTAILLGVICFIILGYIDNFLKPKLIGDKIQLSSFAVFLGVIGGLQLFGLLGFFFGPIILALLVTMVQIYREMIV
jgi:predicted PurR-regulated permease PerM